MEDTATHTAAPNPTPQPPTIEDRLAALESKVAAIPQLSVTAIQTRLTSLETNHTQLLSRLRKKIAYL
jgi:hypothetical protein